MNANRSAALFAERLLLVEGVTEAAVVREFGWVWAGVDQDKEAFIDALSIVPMMARVGAWAIRLLATRDHELCRRVAVLRDSDLDFTATPAQPAWASEHDPDVLLVAHCHPTLEPQLTTGNEGLVANALTDLGLPAPDPVDTLAIHTLFRGAHMEGETTIAAGPGGSRKAEFAIALAQRIRDARQEGSPAVHVPDPMRHVFEFLYEAMQPPGAFSSHDIPPATAPPPPEGPSPFPAPPPAEPPALRI